jgi:hypothetical protein
VFQPVRRFFGARALVLVCGVLLVAWSVPLIFLLNRPTATDTVPAQLISDQQVRTVAAADRIRGSLSVGYADVAAVAAAIDSSTSTGRIRQLLNSTLKEHSRYRSLYVVARDGSVLARVGQNPRHQLDPVPPGGGVVQLNISGRVPTVAVHAAVPATVAVAGKLPLQGGEQSPVAVVGEFDTSYLDSILNHAGMGHVWLVDAHHKVIGSDSGFRAFQSLPDSSLTQLIVDSPDHATHSIVPTSDGAALAASAPIGTGVGIGSQSSWQVVSAQPEAWLDLSANRTQRLTMLVGLLGLTSAIICLGWLFVVVVRPLRELAGIAEHLALGDRRTVLYPVHHDEVGSITRSLEVIRQRLTARNHVTTSSASRH